MALLKYLYGLYNFLRDHSHDWECTSERILLDTGEDFYKHIDQCKHTSCNARIEAIDGWCDGNKEGKWL